MSRKRKCITISLLIGCIAVLVGLTPQMAAIEENMGLHLLFHLRGVRQPPDQVVVVALDRQSSRELALPMEPRKWPRSVHAQLIDRLHEAGAAVIVFDLIFNEPQGPETDMALAASIQRAGNVILAQSVIDDQIAVTDLQGTHTANLSIERTVPPIPLLARASYAQAPFLVPRVPIKISRYWTFKPGAGDIPTMPVVAFYRYSETSWIRFAQLLQTVNDGTMPASFSFPALPPAEHLLPAIADIRTLFMKNPSLGRLIAELIKTESAHPVSRSVQSMIKLNQSESTRYIDFYGPAGTIETIPYYRMMMPSAQQGAGPIDLAGKAVFVGQTESYWPKAKDGFYTVYAQEESIDISGVEIAATAFANLVENRSVRPLRPLPHLLVIFAIGLMAAFMSFRLSATLSALGAAALAGAYTAVANLQFSTSGTWMPVILPLCLIPSTWVCALACNYRNVSRERRTIREAFGYFLPNRIVDQLSKNIMAIRSERQAVYSICLFTDAEKYTNLSEAMEPAALTELMNRYYEVIFKPIRDNDGIVLQVIGDSVLSIWTSSQPDTGNRGKACNAALAVNEAVTRFNHQESSHALPTRIGLHAGEVVLGSIGAMDHYEYRPVGDIVNTASRLEGLNKYLGTRTLVSEVVLGQIEGFVSRYVGKFIFVGKSKPIAVHELIAVSNGTNAALSQWQHQFAEGMAAFEARYWDDAERSFANVLKIRGGDGPSAFFIEQCRLYRAAPPMPGWDGTIYLKHK